MLSSPLSQEKLSDLAGELGSDCPFFLQDAPMMMEGRGDLLSQVKLSLDALYLVVLFPEVHISTAEAYGGITPAKPDLHLRELIETSTELWKDLIVNDFENSIFARHPIIKKLKNSLYDAGAIYASMSGSGSSLFGIFKSKPELTGAIQKYVIWKGPA